MVEEKNLAFDEANRLARHEAIKDTVRREAQGEIVNHAQHLSGDEQARAASLGQSLKSSALNEVVETESELSRARTIARASQFIDYFFYLIYGFISLQILLDLLGARRGNGLRTFVDQISGVFLAPFNNLIPDLSAGRFQVRFSYFVALAVYLLLHLAINGFLKLFVHRKTTI